MNKQMYKKLVLASIMVISAQSAQAFDSTMADSVVGCVDQEKVKKLVSYAAAKDTEAFSKAVLLGVSDGSCAVFNAGDSVDVTDVTLGGLNKV
ncbi:MAG: hypothetical protein LUQ48_08455, partial [Methylococcaceae bacterium]|nr:hypothetical protein [Methylococcaceae bacterium]